MNNGAACVTVYDCVRYVSMRAIAWQANILCCGKLKTIKRGAK